MQGQDGAGSDRSQSISTNGSGEMTAGPSDKLLPAKEGETSLGRFEVDQVDQTCNVPFEWCSGGHLGLMCLVW